MPLTGPGVFTTGIAAPPRRTFGDAAAELARPYNPDDPDTLAMARDSLNAAIREYDRYLWPWEILTTSLVLASGTDTYALPSQFKAPLSCHFTTSGRRDKRINYMPYGAFVNEWSLKHDGTPSVYTLKNQFESGQVTFLPRPSSAFTVDLDYYRSSPTAQVAETPFEFPSWAEEAILIWADYRLIQKLPGRMGLIPFKRRDAERALNELVQMCAQRGDNVGYV